MVKIGFRELQQIDGSGIYHIIQLYPEVEGY